MDGMLSQDEINALLSGMDNATGTDAPAAETADTPEETSAAPSATPDVDETLLTDIE